MLFRKRNTREGIRTIRLKILKLLADGFLVKQITSMLGEEEPNIRYHIRMILKKFNAKNIPNACYLAAKEGLI